MNPLNPTRCKSCRHPLAPEINDRLRNGDSPEAVSEWLGRMGERHRLSGKSIRLHRNAHVPDLPPPSVPPERRFTGELKRGDLAELVRDIAVAKVEGGTLDPTLSEGLRAQEMIDRRAEKGSDRDVMLAVAGLLSGAVVPVAISSPDLPALGDGIEDGWYRSLDDEREADLAEFAALAGDVPARLVPLDRTR